MGENSSVQFFLHQEEKLIGIKEWLILGGNTVAGPFGAFAGLLLFMLAENMGEGFLRVGERGIEIAEDIIKDAKTKGGKRAELAKLAQKFLSPGLNLSKSFFNPDALKNILGNKNGAVEGAKKFFNELSQNEVQRKAFEEEVLKFLTGRYEEKEFEKEIKDRFGIKIEKEALDLYLEFRDFIFNDNVERTLAEIETIGQTIISQLIELKKQSEHNLKELETKHQKFRENIFLLDEGFRRITPLYFHFYKSEGIDYWKEASKPYLIDVYEGFDYRRKIVDAIEKEGNFLILGESGYSKSTTLYRVVCDFYAKNYSILISSHDFGGGRIEHPQKIIDVVEDLLSEGNVLVAVDEVENKTDAFRIIQNLAKHRDFKKIKFVFAARQPEFSDILEKKKYSGDWEAINDTYDTKIKPITIDNFDAEEAEGFVRKFYPLVDSKQIEETNVKEVSLKIYELSKNGHPVLFKSFLTGEGIKKDVEKKYANYIFNKKIEIEDETRRKAALFSCILDLCGIEIRDDLADRCNVDLRLLENTILKYKEGTGTWETLHPVWNIQFLSFWYSKHVKDREKPENTIRQIVDSVVNLSDEEKSYRLLNGLANIVASKQELLGLFEPSLEVPDYIGEVKKARLYIYGFGKMWIELERYEKLLDANTKAIKIFEKLIKTDEKFKDELAGAYNDRGIAHSKMEEYDLAILDFDRAIELNPKDETIYNNRGIAQNENEEYDLAIQDFDRAIELNPTFTEAYYNRGYAHSKMEEYDLAILDFDRAIELNPKDTKVYKFRGITHIKKREYNLAILDYNRVIELNPKDAKAYYNRGYAHIKKREYDLAIQDFDRAIELNPTFTEAYCN